MAVASKQLMVGDYTQETYDIITEMSSQNKSTKQIRELLNLNGRSFLKAFRDKESEVYKAFKRGLKMMEITKEDALIQRIEEKNLTAIEIHDKQIERRRIDDARFRVFGI